MDLAHRFQGGIIRKSSVRPPAETIAALLRFSTSILSDCLDHLNALDPAIRSLATVKPFAGPAVTVEEIEGGNLMSHLALSCVSAGDVLVIQSHGVTTRACWGGLQTLAAKSKGVVAIVVDGAVRDIQAARQLDIPIYARAVTPAGPHKGGSGRVNVPIACGGQTVQPGDIVVGDEDGIVIVPLGEIESLLAKGAARVELEAAWEAQVRQGRDTAEILGLNAKIAQFGIRTVE